MNIRKYAQLALVLTGVSTSFHTLGLSVIAFADWPEFRNGGASITADSLPTQWTPEQGIAWQKELPGYGQSTPIIFGGKVFVTCVEGPMKDEGIIACLDIKNGETIWEYKFDTASKAASNYMASRAAPTPVVDEQAIYAFFESGDVVAVNHAGEKLWHRNLTADYGSFDNNHGLGSSPTQTKGQVIINIEHKGPSYIVALNKYDGETAWKTDRKSASSWTSPIAYTAAGKEQVAVSSSGSVAAYDAATGKELWNLEGFEGNSTPSPTLVGQKLFIGARLPEFANEGSLKSNACINLAGNDPEVLWRAEKALSDYASPVVASGCVYFVNGVGVLSCLDEESGKTYYSKRLGTQCWSTPIVAGENLYFFGKDGVTKIIRAGNEYEEIASNSLWDLDNPPKPEIYIENNDSGRGHGGGGRPGGGMVASLMKGDKNGDNILSPDEISDDFKPMMASIDTNGDGSLDQSEIEAMAKSFEARRASSQDSARDPIVYGAAASDGAIIIRTGTRLYCVK